MEIKMNQLIAKYVNAYQIQNGNATEKVKQILMHHSHSWDWVAAESLISDLIDDTSLDAEDIVAFLADSYRIEGGSAEFHAAVHAMQVCLRKDELERASTQQPVAEDLYTIENNAYETHELYSDSGCDLLNTMRF